MIVVLCLSAFAFTACDKASVTLSKTELSLNEGGQNANLVATVEGSKNTPTWSVSDDTVVSIEAVDTVCTVKPLKQGSAVITVTVGKASATCTVTVGEKVVTEVVTITLDGAEVSTLTMDMGANKTLVATASKGSLITWQSSNDNVATVENGVVTAVAPGTATVIAAVSNLVKAEVTVTVNKPAGSDYYDLKCCAEGGTTTIDDDTISLGNDEFFYWAARSTWGQQQVDVAYAYYMDGQIKFSYTCDTNDGYNYGFQLMYKNGEHTVGNYYKLSCKINVDQDCRVNLNGNDVDLKEGDNDLTVYYQYTDPLGSGTTYGISSFDLVMGYSDGTQTGVFVQNAVVTVSDVKWEEDNDRQKLSAPSFTLENGVISITDSNTAGVGGYLLNVYSGVELKTTIAVENGKKVDTSRVSKGTYTIKLVAQADNTHYIDSDPSESSATIEVNTDASYDMDSTGANGAKASPGVWTYWSESWVAVTDKSCIDIVVTLTFSNNSGNWYDTQLFYKSTETIVGNTYKLKVTINSTGAGRVTLNEKVITLQEGEHDYEVTYTESDGASFTLVMGVYEENNKQEIQSGTIVVSNLSFEETEAPTIEGDFVNGGAADSLTYKDKWIYWYSQESGWAGGVVTIDNVSYDEGVLTLKYSATEGTYFYGTQLFYKNSTNYAGNVYKLTLKVNSSVAGDITVNGKVFALKVGDNNIEVEYTEAVDAASLSLQFGKDGVSTILGGTFKLSNLSFEYVSGDATGGDQGGDQKDPYDGLTPSNPQNLTISGTLSNGDEAGAVSNPGSWIYWNAKDLEWGIGGVVTINSATIANDKLTLDYSATEGTKWFGMQLFYKNSALTTGNKYQLTLKINSSVAGKITVNGTVVDLVAGDNEIKVNYTESANNASISIQFGKDGTNTSTILNGTFVLSDVVISDLVAAQ